MQTIVEVQFVMDTHGEIVRNAPFMVRVDNIVEFYEDEPVVLAQIDDNPPRAYFEAQRKPDGDWRFLSRVSQEEWLLRTHVLPAN